MADKGPIYLYIDATDVMKKAEALRRNLSDEQVHRAMRRVYRRVPGHVRMILRQDLPKKYYVKPGEISATIKKETVSDLSCSIPVEDKRRDIGGEGVKAYGGAHGWNNAKIVIRNGKRVVLRRRKYRVKAKIVKSAISTLPPEVSHLGGNAPFRNLGSKIMPLTWTRDTKKRLPITKMVSVAIPQMPMNRSEADVQKDIKDYMYQRLEHEFNQLLGNV